MIDAGDNILIEPLKNLSPAAPESDYGAATELQPNHSVLVAASEGETATLAKRVIVRRLVNDRLRVTVNGSCSPKFERVRDAFETNFRERDEVGAAVAVWVDGHLAVNLWGGTSNTEQDP